MDGIIGKTADPACKYSLYFIKVSFTTVLAVAGDGNLSSGCETQKMVCYLKDVQQNIERVLFVFLFLYLHIDFFCSSCTLGKSVKQLGSSWMSRLQSRNTPEHQGPPHLQRARHHKQRFQLLSLSTNNFWYDIFMDHKRQFIKTVTHVRSLPWSYFQTVCVHMRQQHSSRSQHETRSGCSWAGCRCRYVFVSWVSSHIDRSCLHGCKWVLDEIPQILWTSKHCVLHHRSQCVLYSSE